MKLIKEEEAKRLALLKLSKTKQDIIRLEKRYQKMRPFLPEAERRRLDELSGWFEHQDN